MNIGIFGWIPERFSLQLIAVVIFFVLPAACVLLFATFVPLAIWGEFWKEFRNEKNADIKKWKKSDIFFIVSIICIAATMYVVWIRWLWSIPDTESEWLLDILYGKGNARP